MSSYGLFYQLEVILNIPKC